MSSRFKNFLRVGCLVSSLALFIAPSYADTTFTLNFDENGNGTLCIFNGGCSAAQSYVGIDPLTGLNTLIYELPVSISQGQVGIMDSGGSLSDVIDFFNQGAVADGYMAYYSHAPGPDLADTVTDFSNSAFDPARAFSINENADGTFSYAAGSGDPSATNFYNGISTAAVPEPSALTPLAGALIALGYGIRRKLAK
jgi:hypothetical protein